MHYRRPASGTELLRLNASGLILADQRQDIRSRTVIDRSGVRIGRISDLFLDAEERKVRMLEIRAIGFFGIGERHVLLPVDAVTAIIGDDVHIDVTHDLLVRSPAYNPALIMPPIKGAWENFYGYYGLPPHWADGYIYPMFAFTHKQSARTS